MSVLKFSFKLLSLVLCVCLIITSIAAVLVVRASDSALELETERISNTGAVITANDDIIATTNDNNLVTIEQTDDNRITVTAVEGAVGTAEIEVSSYGEEPQTVEIPVGYTTFVFDGDTLTVIKGKSNNYEITGINAAGEEYTETSETEELLLPSYTDDDGNKCYQNTSSYSICVEIKKKGGKFVFTGESDDMAIAVKKELADDVHLYLYNLNLASKITSPITVRKNGMSTVSIKSFEGSVNTLSDNEYNNSDNYADNLLAESSVIKGKNYSNITLCGKGTLNVNCNSKNAVKMNDYSYLTIKNVILNIESVKRGISCDNQLDIESGNISINSEGDGICTSPDAVDSEAGTSAVINISGGSADINSGADGIQSLNTINMTAGSLDITSVSDAVQVENDFVMSSGVLNIASQNDGIQSSKDIHISGGSINIKTLGGYNDSSFNKSTMSCKGIKSSVSKDDTSTDETDTSEAENAIYVSGGDITLNTADDGIHSDAYAYITGGNIDIYTGDDGVHADTTLIVGNENGSDDDVFITVNDCYEGLESGTVYVYSGTISITGEDDGINAGGGADSSGGNEGFNPGGQQGPGGQPGGGNQPGGGSSTSEAQYFIYMYGGNIYINVEGDGMDANGSIFIYGGFAEVWGMKANGDNEPLDVDNELEIKGATVFGAGSYGMGGCEPNSNSQYSVSSRSTFSQGTYIGVYNSSTLVYGSTAAPKQIGFVFYTSPDMTSSSGYTFSSYTPSSGGSSSTSTAAERIALTYNSSETDFATVSVSAMGRYSSSSASLGLNVHPSNASVTIQSYELVSGNNLSVSSSTVKPSSNAVAYGLVKVTAKDNFSGEILTDTISVAFTKNKIKSVSVSPTSLEFEGKSSASKSITPSYTLTSSTSIYGSGVQAGYFVSSDEKVATVSSGGSVTPVGVGNCVITFYSYDGGYTGKTSVTVNGSLSFSGRIVKMTDKDGGYSSGVSGARITIGELSATSSSDGNFTLEGLEAGKSYTAVITYGSSVTRKVKISSVKNDITNAVIPIITIDYVKDGYINAKDFGYILNNNLSEEETIFENIFSTEKQTYYQYEVLRF